MLKKICRMGWLSVMLWLSMSYNAMADSEVVTQMTLTDNACDWYKQQDAALNQTWQRLLAAYAHEKIQQKRLRRAQRAWLRFRNAELALTVPTEHRKGSVVAMCRCMKAGRMTAERQSQLAALLAPEEGDVCSTAAVNSAATDEPAG